MCKLEEKWKSFHVLELEVYAKRSELMYKQSKVLMDAVKTYSHCGACYMQDLSIMMHFTSKIRHRCVVVLF